jgi:hypothetical protein
MEYGEVRYCPEWSVARLPRAASSGLLTTSMSAHAMATTLANGDASHVPIEVSFPLPRAPHTNIHLQLTNNGPNLLLFLTTSSPESATSSALGSFVYAMPNVRNLHLFASLLWTLADQRTESCTKGHAEHTAVYPRGYIRLHDTTIEATCA